MHKPDMYSTKMKSVRTKFAALPMRKPDFIEPMECALVSALPEGPEA
jgi:hypothetical protein